MALNNDYVADVPDVQRFFPLRLFDPNENGYAYCQHLCRIVVRATSMYHPWIPIVPHFEIVAQATMHFE